MTDPLYPRHANSGPVPEVTPPLDPDDGYAAFVDAMAPHCRCRNTVCAGVLAGGFCDTWTDAPLDGLDEDAPDYVDTDEDEP